ncbi:DUF6083 domain-containing protein [Streptomyces sp. NPDC102381]|uniref:DUF6083 domain-containing protein n=1 Tax=Streptomyces sp. NPDC102381 TaxID=3366164 RepID=UPI00381877D9
MVLHTPGSLPRTGRCRRCGNPVAWHPCGDRRFIALHPAELPVAHVPAACRWHLSSGVAHRDAGGQAWCRIPHAPLCPARTHPHVTSRTVDALRRQLGLRSRRLIDQGTFTPPAPPDVLPVVAHPVVQLLLGRYLADSPLEDLRCIARTAPDGHHCLQGVLNPRTATGTWRLLPLHHQRSTADTPARLMAVYDLTRAPAGEQHRWRAQLCPRHATARPDLTQTGWQVFDPVAHAAHIRTRLPHTNGPAPA